MKKLTKCFTKISILDNEYKLINDLKKLGFKRITKQQMHKNITIYFGVKLDNYMDYLVVQNKLHNICETLHLGVC